MDLTKEHFDTGISDLKMSLNSLDGRVSSIEQKLETIEEKMVTKVELAIQTKELQQYTDDAFATQQIWMEERFKELIAMYDVRERVEKLEQEFREFKFHKTVHA